MKPTSMRKGVARNAAVTLSNPNDSGRVAKSAPDTFNDPG